MSTDRAGRNAAIHRFRRLEPVSDAPIVIPVEPAQPVDPRAVEFVRFCYLRRRVSWPELYDEMCLVAARGSFRGMSYDDLSEVGVSFGLAGLPPLIRLSDRVVAEERALARGLVSTGGGPRSHPHLTPVAG